MTTQTRSTVSMPILGLLGIVFVTLKLCNVIDWSWWWVTAPFWGGLAVFLAFGAMALMVMGIVAACAWIDERNNA
jgi:hypothetical protein